VGQRRCHTPCLSSPASSGRSSTPRAIVKNECLLQSRIRGLLDRPVKPGDDSLEIVAGSWWTSPERGLEIVRRGATSLPHTLPVIARFKRAIQYPRAIVKDECCSNPVFGGYWIARSSRAMTALRLLASGGEAESLRPPIRRGGEDGNIPREMHMW
jgi:hypothetical protein